MTLVHVVDDHPFVRATLVEVLREGGFEVEGFDDGEAMLTAYLRRPPALLLTSEALPGLSGPELVERLRSAGEESPAIVMLSAKLAQGISSPQLRGLDVDRLLSKPPPSILGLPALLRGVLAERAQAQEEEVQDHVDAQAFKLLSGVWRRRRSGVVSQARDGAPLATLHRGDPTSAEGLQALRRALKRGGVTFSPVTERGSVPIFNLGPDLFDAATRVDEPVDLSDALDQLLVGRGGERRVVSLPLSRPLERLLRRPRGPSSTLRLLLRMEQTTLEEVGPELAALIRMGVYRLRPVAPSRPAPPAPEAQPARARPAAARAPVARTPRSGAARQARVEAVSRHLRETAERLESLNDWEVLGIPEGADRALLQRALGRQLKRYKALVDEPALGEAERAFAAQIVARVTLAGERLRTGGGGESGGALHMAEVALSREDYAQAARHLAVARGQDPMNALVLGKLSWAVYMCPGQRPELQRKAREQLDLALSMADSEPELHFLSAKIDAQEGLRRRAIAKLQRVLRLEPEHAGAQRLRVELVDL